jgi:hypothetical protein
LDALLLIADAALLDDAAVASVIVWCCVIERQFGGTPSSDLHNQPEKNGLIAYINGTQLAKLVDPNQGRQIGYL